MNKSVCIQAGISLSVFRLASVCTIRHILKLLMYSVISSSNIFLLEWPLVWNIENWNYGRFQIKVWFIQPELYRDIYNWILWIPIDSHSNTRKHVVCSFGRNYQLSWHLNYKVPTQTPNCGLVFVIFNHPFATNNTHACGSIVEPSDNDTNHNLVRGKVFNSLVNFESISVLCNPSPYIQHWNHRHI